MIKIMKKWYAATKELARREEDDEDMKKSRKPVSDSSRHPKHPLTSLMPREGLPFENPVEDSYDTGVIVRGGGYWDGVPWRAGMTRERLFLGHDQQDDKTMKSRQQIGLGFRCAWTMPTRTPYGDSLPIDIDP